MKNYIFLVVIITTILSCSNVLDTKFSYEKIIFRQNIGDKHLLFIITDTGSHKRQITQDFMDVDNYFPFSLSDDASRVSFFDMNESGSHLYIYKIKEQVFIKVPLEFKFNINSPVISPDNFQIIFTQHYTKITGNGYDDYTDLWIVDIDGNNLTKLFSSSGRRQFNAQFSANGEKVLISGYGIFLSNRDGSNTIRLTEPSSEDGYDLARKAKYSYDKSMIVYLTISNPNQIIIMNSDGTNKFTLITHNSASLIEDVYFHPDGKRILYVTSQFINRNTESEVRYFMVNIDGSENKEISSSFPYYYDVDRLSFSQDGSKIITSSLEGIAKMEIENGHISIIPNTKSYRYIPSYPLYIK